jgi:hypothetical protein
MGVKPIRSYIPTKLDDNLAKILVLPTNARAWINHKAGVDKPRPYFLKDSLCGGGVYPHPPKAKYRSKSISFTPLLRVPPVSATCRLPKTIAEYRAPAHYLLTKKNQHIYCLPVFKASKYLQPAVLSFKLQQSVNR